MFSVFCHEVAYIMNLCCVNYCMSPYVVTFFYVQLLRDVSPVPIDVIHGDILRYDLTRCIPADLAVPWADAPPKLHIMGNLPFNVSTPLIVKWLREISLRSGAWTYGRTRMTLTFQKEVAERMVAQPKDDQRSRLSIMTQYLCDVQWKQTIPGEA